MKKVIFIGNSPTVLNKQLGNKIDEYDIVIRCNDFEIEGYEKYVGTKTNIWSTTSSPLTEKQAYKSTIRFWMKYYGSRLSPFNEIWTIREVAGSSIFIDNKFLLPPFENKHTKRKYIHKHLVNGKLEFVNELTKQLCSKLPGGGHHGVGTGFLTLLYTVHEYGQVTSYGNSFFSELESKNSTKKLGKHYFTMDDRKFINTERSDYFKLHLEREDKATVLNYNYEIDIVQDLIRNEKILFLD